MFNTSNTYILGASTLGGVVPTDIDGCMLWLRSDLEVTKSGANLVSVWTDQSDGGNNFIQPTEDNQPVWTPNNLGVYPGIIFDGVNDLLYGGTSWPAVAEYYLVMKQIGWTHDRYVSGESVTAWAHLIAQQNPSPSLALYHNGAAWACHNDELAVGSYGLVQALFNGANSLIRINGGTPTTGNPGNTLTAGPIGIGGKYNDSIGANVGIVEVIAYSPPISDGDRLTLQTYIHTRYPSLW